MTEAEQVQLDGMLAEDARMRKTAKEQQTVVQNLNKDIMETVRFQLPHTHAMKYSKL